MIITGGVNIFPQEAEDVLALHEAVLDVAVVGVPDEDLGEVAKAVVQPAPGVTTSDELAEELMTYVQSRLSRYKCPRSVDFVAELPRTPTGKLVKGELTRRYRELAASDAGGTA
jgi:fatty-acyl-CoA synthase